MPPPRSSVRKSDVIATRKLFRQLPQAAKDVLGDILDEAGDQLLAAMKADVPVATGYLRGLLSKKLNRTTLNLRVGFIGKRSNGPLKRKRRGQKNDQFVGNQFYGRFVEFGRKAQVVNVTRGAGRATKNGGVRSAYRMKVSAMAARPFVYTKRTDLRRVTQARLRVAWDMILGKASAGTLE